MSATSGSATSGTGAFAPNAGRRVQELVSEPGPFRQLRRRVAAVADGAAAAVPTDYVDRFVVTVMSLDLLTTVLLQRIYIQAYIVLGTHLMAMGVMLVRGRLRLSVVRVVLYWLFFGTAIAMQILSGLSFGVAPIALAIVCYIPFLFTVPASRATYLGILRNYQWMALGVAALVFIDIAVQLVGLPMPSMDAILPARVLPLNMNYIQPIAWNWGFYKPNAFFMLEASYTSQFLALAIVFELMYFRRWILLGILVAALGGTFSGTGVLLLLLTLPVVMRSMWRQMLLAAIFIVPIFAGVMVVSGYDQVAAGRAETFQSNGSSANQRFVAPYEMVAQVLRDGDAHDIMFGFGAGRTSNPEDPGLEFANYNSMTKVFLEYGLLPAAIFLIFSTYILFGAGAPFVVCWAIALEYHLMGGHMVLSPVLTYCYVLTCVWGLRTGAGRTVWRRIDTRGGEPQPGQPPALARANPAAFLPARRQA